MPALADGMRFGSACASAPSTTSTTRCEVSTLPAATARGGRAASTQPSGAMTSSGAYSPWLVGASSGKSRRKA